MKKMTKHKLIVALAVSAFCIGAFGVGNVVTTNAEATPEESPKFTLTENSFIMEGASIRMENDENGNGIRFPVRLAYQDYQKNSDFIVETGTLIVPKTHYTAGCLTVENALTENSVVEKVETTEDWFKRTIVDANLQTTEYAESLVYLYNIPALQLDEEFYVRGYIKTATDIVYSSMVDRSMSEVAYSAIESGYYAGNDTAISTLQGYLKEYTVEFAVGEYATALENQTVKYGETVEMPELVLTNDDMVFSHWELNGVKYDFKNKVTSNITLTAKYIPVSQYLESKFRNKYELMILNDKAYEKMISNALFTDKYNNPLGAKGWYLENIDVGYYEHINIDANANGSALRLTFPRQQKWDKNGSLKIRMAARSYQTLFLFNYDATSGRTPISTIAGTGTTSLVWEYIYVPVAPFLNADGVLEGLQFSYAAGGQVYFGTIEYVPYAINDSISTMSKVQKSVSYDISTTVTDLDKGTVVEGADIRYTVANESILTIADGKLNALAVGATKVTIDYYVNNTLKLTKVVSVEVTKSDLEIVADRLNTSNKNGKNYLATYDCNEYKTAIISNLTLTGKTSTRNWSLANMGDINYSSISSNDGGTGLSIKFANPLTVSGGYLKIKIGSSNGSQVLSFYKYGTTESSNAVSVAKYMSGTTEVTSIPTGWSVVYVPVENLLNNGVLDGIQFIYENPKYGDFFFGVIEYVAEMP